MKQTASLIRKFSFVVLSITLALASCSKKDSGIAASNAGPFAGQYLVVDEDESYTSKEGKEPLSTIKRKRKQHQSSSLSITTTKNSARFAAKQVPIQ